MTRHGRRQRRGGVRGWLLALLAVAAVAGLALVAWRNLPRWFGYSDPQLLAELKDAELDPGKTAAPAAVQPKNGKDGPFDWPRWRGPRNDGVSLEKGFVKDWPADLVKKYKAWEAPTGLGYATVAVAAGRVYTLVQDGDDEAAVCWDADTGKELWRFRYPCKYENGYGSGPRATPTVDGDLVYTVSATGILHCLKTQPKTAEGEKVWRLDLLDEFKAENLRWGVSFSPLVEGDRLFVMPGGPDGNSLAALDKRTGKLLWKSQDDPAGYSSPVGATLAGRHQILFFTGAGLVGVTPEDGKLLWRVPWDTSYDCNIATPIVAGDYVFISSGYGRGCSVVKVEKSGDTFAAKRVYENTKMRNHFSSSVRHEDHVYGFSDAVLTCLEFRTGKVAWTKNGLGKGSLLIADGCLIILGEQGTLALAEATPAEYRQKASVEVFDGKCWSAPVLANGRLYVRDEAKLICLDLRKK